MSELGRQGIYAIQQSGNTVYVGSSKNIIRKWQEHTCRLRKGTHHNKQLQALWNAGAMQLKVLEFVEDSTLLIQREQHWIDEYSNLVNIMRADRSSRNGHPMPKEAMERTRQANIGVPKTPEARRKISKALKSVQHKFKRDPETGQYRSKDEN